MKHLTKFETLEQAQGLVLDHTNTPHISLIEELRNTTSGGLTFTNYIPLHDYSKDYFTLVALENCNFAINYPSGNVSYSIDNGETWSEPSKTLEINNISTNNKVLLKGNLYEIDINDPDEHEKSNDSSPNIISSTGNYEIEGNIMSLLFEDNFTDKYDMYGKNFSSLCSEDNKLINAQNLILPATTLAESCYSDMFSACTALTTTPVLPATTLAYNCYSDMFSGCTSLTTAPELPATTLAESCYNNMFSGCTALTTAPELPATTLVYNCYAEMFRSCTALTTAPELPATTLAENCYFEMFYYCESLTTAPELPATTLAEYCYYEMFSGCTALTTAPELPATTLAENCYSDMFKDCTSLVTAPELPATTLAYSCYSNMFELCTALTTAPELPATTLTEYCYSNMFKECKALTTAPELPATTLANYCYMFMFAGCISLNYVKCLATDISAYGCLMNWMDDVGASGTFVKDSNTNFPRGTTGMDSGIPSGWTIENV